MTTVIFSHGKESGPWGSKITTMSKVAEQLGFRVESIDYQDLTVWLRIYPSNQTLLF